MRKVKLGDVAIEHKETLKGSKQGLPVVGLEHLIPSKIRLQAWDMNVDNTFTKVFRKGNVLFGRRRAYLKKAVYAEFDGICSGDITVIEALPDKILPELLPFIIQNDLLFDYAVSKSAGSLSPRVKWEHLKNFEFELPEDMSEQKKLADMLWSMIETEEKYEDMIVATENLAKSQFIEQLKIWKENGIGVEVRLGDYVKIRTGKLDANAADENGAYPFFTCSRDISRINTYSFDCECVLVAGNGELNAKYYNGKFDAYQRTYVIESKDSNVLAVPFLYRFLSQYVLDLQNKAIGGVIKYIKLENLTNAKFVLPEIREQEKLLHFINQTDKSKFELEKCLKELKETYKKVISQYLG